MLRGIPDLVAEMEGDPERIYAYHDQYPKKASLAQAIHTMPAPAVMAVWQGTAPGTFGSADVWKHQITLYLRARETDESDPPAAYYRLLRLITKGVPAGSEVPMLNATVHPSCYPMDLPLIQATILVVSAAYCLANLTADLLYAYVNPKIRHGMKAA